MDRETNATNNYQQNLLKVVSDRVLSCDFASTSVQLSSMAEMAGSILRNDSQWTWNRC